MLWPVLRWPTRLRAAGLTVAGVGLLILPAVVPIEGSLGRVTVAVVAATCTIKLFDLHRGATRSSLPSWPSHVVFLASAFSFVYRRLDAAPIPTPGQTRDRVLRGLGLLVVGGTVFATLMARPPRPFLVEHAGKLTSGFAAVYGIAEVAFGAWTAAGLRGLAQFDNFFASRTPADFWRRYNRPVTEFMFENVFLPAGGARHPVAATLAVFLLSGLVHEYIAAVGLRTVQGYQLAFFMIQGVAVAATARLAPRGPVAVALAVTATLIFNILAALLFCATVAQIADLYSADAPAWMPHR